MNVKTWQANWDNNQITVENGWSWSGDSLEKITINDEVMLENIYNMTDVAASRAMGSVFTFPYGDDMIKVTLGSAWHLFGNACRIEVNGKYIGGNKIVLFARKAAQLEEK